MSKVSDLRSRKREDDALNVTFISPVVARGEQLVYCRRSTDWCVRARLVSCCRRQTKWGSEFWHGPHPELQDRHALAGLCLPEATTKASRHEERPGQVGVDQFRMQQDLAAARSIDRRGPGEQTRPTACKGWRDLLDGIQVVCPHCRAPLSPHGGDRASCPNGHGEAALVSLQRAGDDLRFFDLTPERFHGGALVTPRGPAVEMRRDLFQNPFVAFLYERGWRDQFRTSGFPGPDAEFRLVQKFFEGAKSVMDLCCGSGLFTRRLAASGKFEQVFAVDYSEAMLRETLERAQRERLPHKLGGSPVSERITAVIRADVERLPFADESVDCIHAGAALHCWPCVQDGLHEVYRILRSSEGPGTGRFLATTFLWSWTPFGTMIREGRFLNARSGYRFFDAKELEWLLKSAGFERVEIEVIRQCAIIRAWKVPQKGRRPQLR